MRESQNFRILKIEKVFENLPELDIVLLFKCIYLDKIIAEEYF